MGVKYIDQYCDGTLITNSTLNGTTAANAQVIISTIQELEAEFAGYPSLYMCTS